MASKYKNGDYCVPAGLITLAVANGLAVTVLLLPISILLAILAVPINAIDFVTGCETILEL